MKSRISYFNGTALRKDITRFSPIWGIYSVILLLYLLMSPTDRDASYARDIGYLINSMAVVNLIYAGVSAMFLFGDLFNSKLANALHALPMRREGWFLVHTVAGLLFCIVPNTLAALLSTFWLGQYSYIAFLWLAITVMQYLFFFGVGVLAAVCAGNRLGMAAVYGIINIISLIVMVLAQYLFMPLLYGIELNTEPFAFLCPVVHMVEGEYVLFDYNYQIDQVIFLGIDAPLWIYTGVTAAIGLVCLALSVLVYRRRHIERAGDFLSVKALAPVFLVIFTLGVGVIVYIIADEVAQLPAYLFLIIGLFVGFFIGRMFLERRVNVFHPKAFLGFGILTLALGIALAVTWLDPIGMTRYVPDTDEIESVYLYDGYLGGTDVDYLRHTLQLTDSSDLEAITEIHDSLIKERRSDYDFKCTLLYKLKDGRMVKRYYPVTVNSRAGQQLHPFFSSWEYIFRNDVTLSKLTGVLFNRYAGDQTLAIGYHPYSDAYGKDSNVLYYPEELDPDAAIKTLVDALRKDCDEGNLIQVYAYRQDEETGWLELSFQYSPGDYTTDSIALCKSATHTLTALDKLQYQAQNP